MDSLEIARKIAELLEDKKAEEILVLDLRPEQVIADFFVIATGNSDRQLRSLADWVKTELKLKESIAPYAVEGGSAESGWVLMDYGIVMVHLFLEERRQYFDLEGLWRPESKVILSIK